MAMRPSAMRAVSGQIPAGRLTLLLALAALEVEGVDELLEDLQLRVVLALRHDRGPIQDLLRDEDARAAPYREGDRVRRARIELDLLAGDLQEHASQERAAALLVG